MNTSFLLIHCVSPYNAIVERNNSSNSWDQSLIDQLIQRFEEPNDSNRWDSPCITILTTESDDILAHQKDIDDILITSNSGASKKINKLSQNNPTVLKAATSSNFIQVLDATLTDTIKKIIQEVSNGTSQRIILSENRDINEPGCIYLDIPPQAQITLPRLNRLKRQFIQLNKNLRDVDQERIVPLFVAYLDQTFASEY
ncbi:Protein KTI12 [Nakaseomyces bracarensis]